MVRDLEGPEKQVVYDYAVVPEKENTEVHLNPNFEILQADVADFSITLPPANGSLYNDATVLNAINSFKGEIESFINTSNLTLFNIITGKTEPVIYDGTIHPDPDMTEWLDYSFKHSGEGAELVTIPPLKVDVADEGVDMVVHGEGPANKFGDWASKTINKLKIPIPEEGNAKKVYEFLDSASGGQISSLVKGFNKDMESLSNEANKSWRQMVNDYKKKGSFKSLKAFYRIKHGKPEIAPLSTPPVPGHLQNYENSRREEDLIATTTINEPLVKKLKGSNGLSSSYLIYKNLTDERKGTSDIRTGEGQNIINLACTKVLGTQIIINDPLGNVKLNEHSSYFKNSTKKAGEEQKPLAEKAEYTADENKITLTFHDNYVKNVEINNPKTYSSKDRPLKNGPTQNPLPYYNYIGRILMDYDAQLQYFVAWFTVKSVSGGETPLKIYNSKPGSYTKGSEYFYYFYTNEFHFKPVKQGVGELKHAWVKTSTNGIGKVEGNTTFSFKVPYSLGLTIYRFIATLTMNFNVETGVMANTGVHGDYGAENLNPRGEQLKDNFNEINLHIALPSTQKDGTLRINHFILEHLKFSKIGGLSFSHKGDTLVASLEGVCRKIKWKHNEELPVPSGDVRIDPSGLEYPPQYR